MTSSLRFVAAIALVLIPAFARAELKADELALIVNRNSPESVDLANFYAKARQIPDGRVIELAVHPGELMSFEDYERLVVPQVRQALRERGLEGKVKCLVTFYGVPLKIEARRETADDARELANLKAAFERVQPTLRAITLELERRATVEEKAFVAGKGESIDELTGRIQRSIGVIAKGMDAMPAGLERDKKTAEMVAISAKLREPIPPTVADPPSTAPAALAPAATSPATQPAGALSPVELISRRNDPVSRRELRTLAARDGMIGLTRVLVAQIEYLTPGDTDAAFDSELSMVLWPTYPRTRWMPNALHHQFLRSRTPPVLMVSRLDGPSVQKVKDLIATSITVERDGLRGRVVIDAGGAMKLDPQRKQGGFWPFEESFTRLSISLKQRTRLDVMYDDKADVLPPNSAKDVALYTGWYNVGNYIPSCEFTRGAVGYHVASYEMTSLHDEGNNGWCRGLLNNGVTATLGPISEPFLHAFPPPEEFFSLLLTGRMTLAEVYWRSCPLASWKMCLVGDPLYMPYRNVPQLKVSDLPQRLQPLFSDGR